MDDEATCDNPAHKLDTTVSNGSEISAATVFSSNPPLSKSQLKKLRKKERWLANKFEKRAEERQKRKEKRRAAIEKGLTLPPSRKKLKKNKMADSQCKLKVAVDCSFDDLMSEKDIFNMVRQINHCYAANRRAQNPVQFYVTSVEKKTKARLDSLEDFKFWDVNFTEKDYSSVFGTENVVYLSSDSPNILESLDDSKTYIIGGLVDHNHHKGLCLRVAEEKGISHAQLPISEYISLKTRKILSVNQVFEILLYHTECKDWKEAFFRAIPSRKGAATKTEEAGEITQTSSHEHSDSEKDEQDTNDSEKETTNDVMSKSSNKADFDSLKHDVECKIKTEPEVEDTSKGFNKADFDCKIKTESGDEQIKDDSLKADVADFVNDKIKSDNS